MPFAFLNPWFWLGALAVAAPIWLHLHRKQERNLVQFSAVRFLEDQPQARQSPRRLRHWLLFALRALALLCLVAAFAFPYLRRDAGAPILESRVYILDNTFSQQADDRLAGEKKRLLKALTDAAPNVQMAIVELTAAPKVLAGLGENRAVAIEKVQAVQPSFQRGAYLAAFRLANSLLENSLGARKRIVFLSDHQKNQWDEGLNNPPFLRNVEIELTPNQLPPRPNLWLSEPRLQRVFLGDQTLINFTINLHHAGPAKTARVLVRTNDQLVLSMEVDLAKQPETIVLQGQWPSEATAWVQGEAEVEGLPDSLSADNRSFFSLGPVVEGQVALLAHSPYLQLALSADVMKGQWKTRVLQPANLSAELDARDDAEVLLLESSYLQSSDTRKLVWRYLTNRRGVLLLVNRVTPGVTGALRELGFEASDAIAARDGGEKFSYVFTGHPIFHPFLSPDFGNLLGIKVSKYFRLKSSEAMPLIFGESGEALFFQGTKMQGKLFVIGFGLDREHTSWPIDQTFIPFLDLALQAARTVDPEPTNFEPGEINPFSLTANESAVEVQLSQRGEVRARAAVEQGKAKLRMPDQPGLYTLTGKGVRERILSVNSSPKESELNYVESPDALKVWQVTPSPGSGRTAESRTAATLAGILPQRYWWWMMLGGLLMLTLEMAATELKGKR